MIYLSGIFILMEVDPVSVSFNGTVFIVFAQRSLGTYRGTRPCPPRNQSLPLLSASASASTNVYL